MSHIGEVYPDDGLKQQNFTLYPLYLDSETFSPVFSCIACITTRITYFCVYCLCPALSPT